MIRRLALFVSKRTEAKDSSYEILLWWWMRFFWGPLFWQLKRQHKVGPYTIDMAIETKWVKVAVEVDGRYWHRMGEQPIKDANRDKYLEKRGWEVLRFTDKEVGTTPAALAWYVCRFARVEARNLAAKGR